jgi:hypothetical protein
VQRAVLSAPVLFLSLHWLRALSSLQVEMSWLDNDYGDSIVGSMGLWKVVNALNLGICESMHLHHLDC